jgi:hypothetical protein
MRHFFGRMKPLVQCSRELLEKFERVRQASGRRDLRLIAITACAAALAYACAMMAMYSVWLCAWHEIGYAPRYGHPKSYTVGPIADHRLLWAPLVMYLLVLSTPFVVIACLAVVALVLVRRKPRTKDDWMALAAATSTLVLIWFFLWDRYDVLDWYMD